VVVPAQLHPVPLYDAREYPDGSVSLTVTVEPSVAPAAVPELLLTCMFQTAVEPCVNVPVCDLAIASDGGGSIVIVSEAKLPAVMPAPEKVKPDTVADAGALAATFTGKVSSG